jgi:hypothetical protein
MKKLLLALLLTTAAQADEVSFIVDWNTPTKYEDGRPMAQGDISHFELMYLIDTSGAIESNTLSFAGTVNGYTITREVPAQGAIFTLTAQVRTIPASGVASEWSDPATRVKGFVSVQQPVRIEEIKITVLCKPECEEFE